MYKAVLLIIVLFLVAIEPACKQQMRDCSLIPRIESYCEDFENCRARMSDLIGGDWDWIYEFGGPMFSDEVSAILEFPYSEDIPDSKRRLLFVKGTSLVCSIEYPQYGLRQSTISMGFLPGQGNRAARDATYRIVREKLPQSCEGCYFYALYPEP